MNRGGLILLALLLGTLTSAPPARAQIETFPTVEGVSATLDMATGEVELSKWSKEAWMRFSATGTLVGSTKETDKFKLTYGDYFVSVYEIPGGLKYDIIIGKIPSSNVFVLPVISENLEYYYQPPLTSEYVNGAYYAEFGEAVTVTETQVTGLTSGTVYVERPIDVVGSYAVYHPTKTNNEYKTGKAFHIYRPLVIDDKGTTIWGVLNYDGVSLTVTVDQAWLAKAKYPVTVDPGFGYASIGGASTIIPSVDTMYAYGGGYSPANDGTLTSMSVYTISASSKRVRGAIYYTGNQSLVDYTPTGVAPAVANWVTIDVALGEDVFTSETYYIAGWYEVNTYYYYDTVGTIDRRSKAADVDNAPPNPWGSSTFDQHRVYSVYANYTVGGGPTNYPRSASQGITIGGDADRLFNGYRTGTQNLNISTDADRLLQLLRAATQGIGVTPDAERMIRALRAASQGLNLTSDADRVYGSIRGASQGVGLNSGAGRAYTGYRDAAQDLGVASDSDRLFEGSRGGTQTIGVSPDGERIYGAVRSPTQSITLGTSTSRTLTLMRGASQALTLIADAIGSAIQRYIRGVSLSIGLTVEARTNLIMLLIHIVDSLGEALAGSNVAIYYGGSLVEGGAVNATGHYLAGSVPSGNYTIDAYRADYAPQKVNYILVTSYNVVEITLQTFEEAIMFNMELLIFVALASACIYIGYTAPAPGQKILGYFTAMLFWVASMYQWIVSNPGNWGLILAFLAPFLVSWAYGMQSLGQYIDDMQRRGGKRDPFE